MVLAESQPGGFRFETYSWNPVVQFDFRVFPVSSDLFRPLNYHNQSPTVPIALLFLGIKVWTAISDWHARGIADAFQHAKWDAAAQAVKDADLPSIREQLKTQWQAIAELKAAAKP